MAKKEGIMSKSRFIKHYLRHYLSDSLVVIFAVTWLALAFIPMMASPNHTVSFMESNVAILGLEMAICFVSLVWGITRIRRRAHGKT